MQLVNSLRFNNLRGDIYGGLTAAIVALPLALAFGVSSGAGAIAGLYGAIFVGLFAALFGGTPAQISGPTGPMTVVMAAIFTNLTANDPETGVTMAFTVVILGGLFQILFGVLRLGKYITLMPYTVISGFMSGIGLIIIIIQLAPFFGYSGTANVIDSIRNISAIVANPDPAATILGILTLAIVFWAPPSLNRVLPSPLLALIGCTLISVYLMGDSNLHTIGEIPTGLPSLHVPTFRWDNIYATIFDALILATLGSIDSLLTSLVADNMTRTQHNSDRELIGQGIGNTLSGLFGGLPGAGATMRTVVNVHAGGKTALSGIIHGGILLTIVLWAGDLAENIPNVVLAGILIKVGIDIIDWGFLKRAHWVSLKEAAIMYGVMFLTVFVDLITAVAVGVFVANLLAVKSFSDLQIKEVKAITNPDDEAPLNLEEKQLLKQLGERVLMFHLGGPMSFGATKAISQQLAIVDNYDFLILDLSDVPLLDVTAGLAIESMVKDAREKRREVFIVGASGKVKARLRRLKVLDILPLSNQVNSRLEALQRVIVPLPKHSREEDNAIANDNSSNGYLEERTAASATDR